MQTQCDHTFRQIYGRMNKTTNLRSQIRDSHKLFEDILWKNVRVACLFDVIRRHIDVICTQMEIGC